MMTKKILRLMSGVSAGNPNKWFLNKEFEMTETYFFEMAKYCESRESEAKDVDMRAFWHFAKVGFKRRWAEAMKSRG